MFKIGDKVVCINTSGLFSLKLNNIYIIKRLKDGYIFVANDYGHIDWYSPERFSLEIKQKRKEKLISLLQ